jgi:glucose-6-phosphate dehydrogenase assembly protein OpcA
MTSVITCRLGELEKTIKAQETVAQKEKKHKACLFNLIIDVETQERHKYYLKVIKELIDQFPCRIFLVHFDKVLSEPSIEYSFLSPKSAPSIVCDFITININPKDYQLLSSLLNANMVSDLPIFYLPTEHSDHLSVFTFEMAKIAKRVICDSTDVKDIDSYIHNISRLSSALVDVADLNWSRIESWREIISKNLNDSLLNNLKSIEIVYNHKKEKQNSIPFQAVFLKGFLALRLKEKLNSTVDIQLISVEKTSIWEGAILKVIFKDDLGSKQEFLRNLSKPGEAAIHFESEKECFVPQYVQFTKTESGQSLIKEIRHTGVSQDYLKIVTHLKGYL